MKQYYKKQVYLLIGLFVLIPTIVGCQQKNKTIERDNVFEDTQKDTNTAEPQKEKGNSCLESCGASVKDEKSNYEYNGNDVVMSISMRQKG